MIWEGTLAVIGYLKSVFLLFKLAEIKFMLDADVVRFGAVAAVQFDLSSSNILSIF